MLEFTTAVCIKLLFFVMDNTFISYIYRFCIIGPLLIDVGVSHVCVNAADDQPQCLHHQLLCLHKLSCFLLCHSSVNGI